MRKNLWAAVGAIAAVCGAAQTAQAEDWSGLYVGGSVGTTNRDTEWTDVDGDWLAPGQIASDDDVDATSIGAHLGYNWQMGNWVFGAQGGVTYADLQETSVEFGDIDVDNSMLFSANLRANVGYAFGAVLPYITVGAATSDLEHSWHEFDDTEDSWPDFSNETALVYGAGLSYRMAPHWSVGAEYLVQDYGSESEMNENGFVMDVETRVETFQLTLNYHLN